ncbi:hypothetical protein NW767_014758 [Fusarium falciforme]|uniref:Uncharacterized protein n=1 Tax=Fusarium falciforme TaxID=195108 RepID=A0A9W8UV52_9HYPO
MEITLGDLRISLLSVDHSSELEAFNRNWSLSYKNLSAELPPFDITLSAGPGSTHISLGYELEAMVYRATDPPTGKTWAVKRYARIENIR